MLVSIQKVGNTWRVTPLEGLFNNEVVAITEGITLSDAVFDGDTIIGHPSATWGLEILNPEICGDRFTIKGLGIGRTFHYRGRSKVEFFGGEFVDANTRLLVKASSEVTIVMGGIFRTN